jgi:hypothetical protein
MGMLEYWKDGIMVSRRFENGIFSIFHHSMIPA